MAGGKVNDYRLTPAEIQEQLTQCADLLDKPLPQADFMRGWYRTLISARERYLEQEHLTEAEWNVLASQRRHDL